MLERNPTRIEVLGELRVVRGDGVPAKLPASRKTRALLAYLTLTGRRHHRSQLCDLLWDGVDDPRGALRWSLSRLRSVLDRDGESLVESDRRTVGITSERVVIDLKRAKELVGEASDEAPLDQLREAAKLLRGELLEGLDLLDAFRFHSWCAAEREEARALRVRVLDALSSRVRDPSEALLHAHELVTIDPLDEEAQARVVRLLTRSGRHGDAQEQWRAYRRILELELGEVPKNVAARMRRLVHQDAQPVEPRVVAPVASNPSAAVPFTGRDAELRRLRAWLEGDGVNASLCLVAGEPGQGKTRLVAELAQMAERRGHRVVRGRAFQAETVRAFGPWRDALGGSAADAALSSMSADVADLQKRTQLFDELLGVLAKQAPGEQPLLIVLDDLQWLDEASAAFMHYVIRRTSPAQTKIVATSRPAEMVDNPAAQQIVEVLELDDQLMQLTLGPLDRDAVRTICNALGDVDAEDVFARSEGNAFVAVEIAQALARGEETLPENIAHLIDGRLRRLGEGTKELLPWAAALGRTFSIDALERVSGLDTISLVDRVGELEVRGVLEPRGENRYDFTHDLVREAAYRRLSGPRRRMVHRSIARALEDWPAAPASEVLRHAELGSERAIACRASVMAAKNALSVCAWVDACAAADRGLQYTDALEGEARAEALLALLECRVLGGSILQRPNQPHVTEALEEALAIGSPQQRFKALYFRFVEGLEHVTTPEDQETAAAAADLSRLAADPATEARQLAHSARCLLHLERDVGQARGWLSEADLTLEELGLDDVERRWARGLLAQWDGALELAMEELEHAMQLARERNDRWREASLNRTFIKVCLDAGRLDRVEERANARLGFENDDDEVQRSPFIDALIALADARNGGTQDRLDEALAVLREREAWVQASWVLADLARLHYERGELAAAEEAANEARERAEAARRTVALTDALCTLTRLRLDRGETEAGRETLSEALALAQGEDVLPRLLRERLTALARELS